MPSWPAAWSSSRAREPVQQPHRTPGEKRTQAAAAAAVARAHARATSKPPEPETGAPYITPTQARLIRLRIESERKP